MTERTAPTLDDVARAAGVSRATASRVINGAVPVSRPATEAVRKAVAMLGYRRDELDGMAFWTVTPPEYLESEYRQLASLHATGRYGPYEKELIRKDGSRVPVLLNGMCLEDSDGGMLIWSAAMA